MTTKDSSTEWIEGLRDWTHDWGGRLTCVLGAFVSAYLLYLASHWSGTPYVAIVNNAALMLISFGAFLLLWRVSRHPSLDVRTRRAWVLLALAHLSFALGTVLWFGDKLGYYVPTSPSWANSAYLLFYPLAMAALLNLSDRTRNREERIRLWLDTGIVAMAGGLFIWHFLLRQILVHTDTSLLITALSLAYPVSDLMLLIGITGLILRGRRRRGDWGLSLLLLGLLQFLAADVLYVYSYADQTAVGTYQSGALADAMYALSLFAVMVSAQWKYRRVSGAVRDEPRPETGRRAFSLLPYAAIAMAYGLLLIVSRDQWGTQLGELIFGALILTACVVVRQAVAVQADLRTRNALRASEERFQLVARATRDAVWDWDLVTNDLWWNAGVHTIFGYTVADVGADATWWSDHIHPEDRERILHGLHEVIDGGGQVWQGEYRYRCADESFALVIDRGFVVRDEGGAAVRMVGSMMDITERKHMEETLRYESGRMQALMDYLPDAIYFKDTESRFTRVSKHVHLRGISSPDEAIGKTDFDFFEEENARGFYESEQHMMRTGEALIDQVEEEVFPDGSVGWVLTTKVPIFDHEGRVTGIVGASRDVTELKQMEQELTHARDAALESTRLKSEFLANMSHEIRTPMNGILGLTDLVLDTKLDPAQREYLEMVKGSADALLGIINDILDFSKIEAGKLLLDPVGFNLRDTLGDTVSMLALRARQKGLELLFEVDADVPDDLCGDPGRLQQIIINLVGNAIKFTESGEVVVSVETEWVRRGRAGLRFAVRDDGVGIPRDKQRMIFEAFTQTDSSTTRLYGGTGLGLAICSQLIALMDGTISVESEPGRGSTFRFTATFGASTEAAQGLLTPGPAALIGLRTLVVDDSATNRRIVERLLRHWRMRPVATPDGPSALVEVKRAVTDGEPYSLVLLDGVMDGMDGFAVAEQIKRDPRLADATVIMMSSADHPGAATRCLELGIAALIAKPIRRAHLLNALLSATGALPSAAAETRAGALPANLPLHRHARLRVLLAEDNRVNQRVATDVLEKAGHEVTVACDGSEALAALERERFDIVLMDVQMPLMDGFEATAAIRARERVTGARTPIVAMTAHAMKGDRERCLAAGMDGYIAKPFDVRELLDLLARLTPHASGAGGGPPAGARREGPAFDKTSALARLDGDSDLLGEIAGLFLEDCSGLMDEIGAAVSREDGKGLERGAHTLKGSASNFAAPEAQAAALALEEMGRAGDFSRAGEAYGELERTMQALTQALSTYAKETKV